MTFWPTVEAVTSQGRVQYEVCNLIANTDTMEIVVPNSSQCGFFGCDHPPLHSIVMEEDYINPWYAQIRAQWLEHSVRSPSLAPHLDSLFFDHFLKDRHNPVPASDLEALGILNQHRPGHGGVPHLQDPPKFLDPPRPEEGQADLQKPCQHSHRSHTWAQYTEVPIVINTESQHRFPVPCSSTAQHDEQSPDEPDDMSLMARRPQARGDHSMSVTSRSSTSSDISSYSEESPVNWKRTVIYALDGQAHSVLLPWREGAELYTHAAVAFGIPASSILHLHHVGFRPGDLEQMELQALLLQLRHEPRPAPNMQIILLDLEVHEDNPILPGIFRRKAHWAPKITTIDTLFRVIGLTSTYRQHADHSHLWLNNIRIDLQRSTPLHIADGDYLEIFIGDLECRDTLHSNSEEEEEHQTLLQVSSQHAQATFDQPFGCDFSQRYADDIDFEQKSNHSVIQRLDPTHGDSHLPSPHHGAPLQPAVPTQSYSFTDEFLRAVEALRTATEALPEFPEDNVNIEELAPWVRDLYEAWDQLSVIGPGNVERIDRLETWFTDHINFQRCHHTRIAILGGDAHNWEAQIRHLWRQHILPEAPLEFHLVAPIPEDATGNTFGQIILVQRPQRFQRSVILSIYDSNYDRGQAHSHALVMGDRIDLQSIQIMAEFTEDCPPEMPSNDCSLWFGSRQIERTERVYARSGHAFRLVVHRAQGPPLDRADASNLQRRLDELRSGTPLPSHLEHFQSAPDWFNALHRVFHDLAATEREDEGPVASCCLCHDLVCASTTSTMYKPWRTIRLRDQPMAWQRTLLDGEIYVIALCVRISSGSRPHRPRSLRTSQNLLCHIVIAQQLPESQIATLVTARVRDQEGQDTRSVAMCLPNAASAETIVAAFPIPGPLLRFPRRVGRGLFYFAPHEFSPNQSGEGLIIDILASPILDRPTSTATSSGINLLQTQVQLSRTDRQDVNPASVIGTGTSHRVTLNLEDCLNHESKDNSSTHILPCARLTAEQVAHTPRPQEEEFDIFATVGQSCRHYCSDPLCLQPMGS